MMRISNGEQGTPNCRWPIFDCRLAELRWRWPLLKKTAADPEFCTRKSRIKIVFPYLYLIALPLCGYAKESVVQCANLIYGGTHTSRCFSSEFLNAVQRNTTISTERRFKSVKLESDELFNYPFSVMTGESDFRFTAKDRENLEKYVKNGGFLLSSAGCSSEKFDRAFKREMERIFGKGCLKPLDMDHPIFSTVHKIEKLELKSAASKPQLLGLEVNGKIAVIYSHHGLNDTAHAEGCCCCGGNEILNSLQVNVNILVYALLH